MRSLKKIITILLISSALTAGTTGKIKGVVTDAETGEPLTGVNILVEGTIFGSATDLDGYYTILNVPPGTYSLKTNYIGYAEHIINDVKVRIDLTTQLNIALKSELLTTEAVVIVAERPVVTRDISNSQLNIEAAEITALPVENIDRVLTLQAGIEKSSRGIIIRGGGANQTIFMVDGQSFNDERSNYPYSAVSLSSVEEVQVQTGGFNAEYGQARSGIVNVITKEGPRSKYSGAITVRYRPPEAKHFGISVYDPNSYFNRPYFDPAVCWAGTNNGDWDHHMQSQYPGFEGWNAVSEATMKDNDPNNDLTPDGAQQLFSWYRRRQGDITKPDYVIDGGFGGPVPLLDEYLGNLRFYISHFRNKEMFVFPLSRDDYSENHTLLKLTSDLSPAMTLVLSGLYGEVNSVSRYSWTTTPTGDLVRGEEEVAKLTNGSNTGQSIPFMPGYFSPGSIYRQIYGLKFTHTLSSRTFYQLKMQYKYSRNNTYQTTLRDTSRVYEPVDNYFVDEAPFGYWGHSSTGVGGMHLGGWMNLGRDESINSTFSLNLDLSSQYNHWNQIKGGIQLVYNNYDIDSYTENPSMTTWNRQMIYNLYPFRLSGYIQDKMEFQGFIANLGLRIDYSNSNTVYYLLSDYDEYYGAGYGHNIEEEAPNEQTETSFTISPRLGISHPITEDSKLYFNYGHFRSEPFSSYRFRLQREYNGQVTYMGDPNLIQEKTVAYELGYEQNIYDMFLLKIAGYYKDVTNQPGWVLYTGLSDVRYNEAANNNYEDIRGLEFTLTMRPNHWFSGFLNYTYDVRTSGYFGLLEYYEDPNLQREYIRRNPTQKRKHPQPYARANIDLHTPDEYGPQWLGIYPLDNWRLNILADWKTGEYYTYNPYSWPGIVDDTQWKDWYNIDLRLAKGFNIGGMNVQLYIDVKNVLNTKHMNMAGFSDNYDWLDYLESLNFSWEEGEYKGDDYIGEYRPDGVEYDPLEPNPNNDPEITARNDQRKESKSYIDMPNITSFTFLNPRNFTFGITMSF